MWKIIVINAIISSCYDFINSLGSLATAGTLFWIIYESIGNKKDTNKRFLQNEKQINKLKGITEEIAAQNLILQNDLRIRYYPDIINQGSRLSRSNTLEFFFKNEGEFAILQELVILPEGAPYNISTRGLIGLRMSNELEFQIAITSKITINQETLYDFQIVLKYEDRVGNIYNKTCTVSGSNRIVNSKMLKERLSIG